MEGFVWAAVSPYYYERLVAKLIGIDHRAAEIVMLFQPVAPKKSYIQRGYFAYVHSFDVVPQKYRTSSRNIHASVPDPATGMWVLRRKYDQRGKQLGEIVPVKQIYTDVEIAPRFRDREDDWTSYTATASSKIVYLNHYCDREVFYKFEL